MKKRLPTYKGERKRKELRLPIGLVEKIEKEAIENDMTFNDLTEKLLKKYINGEVDL